MPTVPFIPDDLSRSTLHVLQVPPTSLCVSGNLQDCFYSKSEKILGSRDLGARVIVQSFAEEPSWVQLKGVQFRALGQAFRKHLSSLTLVGAMRGKQVQAYDFPFFSLLVQGYMQGP